MPDQERIFLTAEWRDLVMLNYEVEPELLKDRVPAGTVLDSIRGRTYVSLVGFRFLRTKLRGSIAIPFHADFDEVNLRFYVRREKDGELRRGVVFIAEIVPKRAVARIARVAYGENYVCLPMQHHTDVNGARKRIEYAWRLNAAWCRLRAESPDQAAPAEPGSLEQFITEHYWGYSAQKNGTALEYHVSHPPWNVCRADSSDFEGDPTALYGTEFGKILRGAPQSAFLADGSDVTVFAGRRI